ncbi:IS3 family transposase [Microbispora sp. RL4-1S]|uniref:IS3 family transposase n=1 Tax=Microbispora oryzae TaxID=2806554 RepID=A0A941AJZ7_9ACTN|nr:IS3 family transposase [Microbispora oryzae]MBP2706930.1 IS3 family transposase [Microbispora oryzae]
MSVAAFIASQKTEHDVPHVLTCRVLGVSQAWFYKWRDRAPTARRQRQDRLDEAIAARFTASAGTYGSPRIARDLHQDGWRVSVNTVAARMAELGLVARERRKHRGLTRAGKRAAAPDLVRRQFTAIAPDVLWCGDVTEIPTGEGKLYLATVEDLFSRRMLGYAMSTHHDAALTIAALQMAAVTRGGTIEGVIFHSDRGSEYTAARFQAACRHWGVVQSMGRVGCALDNAAAESFNSTLKVEFVRRHRFATRDQARMKIAIWIADFYNPRRRHSAADGLPPIEYEQRIMAARATATAGAHEAIAA